MIKHDVEQGSDLWLSLRFEYITASQAAVLLDLSPYQTPLQLFEEKVMRITPPNETNKQVLFDIGHRVEETARKKINAEGIYKFIPIVATNNHYPGLLASLDGYDDELKIVLETKFVGQEKLEKIKAGVIPAHHNIQIQAQLMVTGATHCFYYAEAAGGEFHTLDIYPDKDLQKEIYRKLVLFKNHLEKGTPPAPGKRDVLETVDQRFMQLNTLHKAIKLSQESFDSLKEEIASTYDKFSKISGPGGLLIKTFREGKSSMIFKPKD